MWPMFDIWTSLAIIMIVKYLYETQSSTSVIGSSSESGQVGSKPNTSRLVIFAACISTRARGSIEDQLKGSTSCWRVFFSADLHLRRHRDLAVQAFNLENFKHRGEILGLSQEDWLGCTQGLRPCCEKSEITWSWLPSGFPSAPPITDWPIGQSDDPCGHHHHYHHDHHHH